MESNRHWAVFNSGIMGVCERDLRWWSLREWPELGFYWLVEDSCKQLLLASRRSARVETGRATFAPGWHLVDF